MRLKPLASADTLFVAASMTRPDVLVTGRDLERAHRNQGYSSIACHFAIERNGFVHEGRPLNHPAALAGKLNSHSYQVVLLGGVNDALAPEHNFTKAQTRALDRLRKRFGLPVVYAPDFPKP
jgi:hypothetical protein